MKSKICDDKTKQDNMRNKIWIKKHQKEKENDTMNENLREKCETINIETLSTLSWIMASKTRDIDLSILSIHKKTMPLNKGHNFVYLIYSQEKSIKEQSGWVPYQITCSLVVKSYLLPTLWHLKW